MPVSTQFRPQPPSIEDPRRHKVALEYLGVDAEAEADEEDDEEGADGEEKPDWARRAQEAFSFSTSYVDSNYRQLWNDSIRAFNSEHSSSSKYNSELFRKRSSIYRPKTRAIIRKNEAAAAAAFFTNPDRTSISALNQSNQEDRVSAEVMQQLLQYRLTKSIPWFMVVLGGIQDAQTQGVVCAHVHWRYVTRAGKVVEDKPVIDLIPVENIRIDPNASWMDPLGTSPYVIHMIPMYVGDVKERMRRPDPKGRRWKVYSDAEMKAAMQSTADDSTRTTRQRNQQDPTQEQRPISDYDVVWVHRHIHKWRGEDYEFYTLASQKLLTTPEPLIDTVFHGKRPYVIGSCLITTHKPYADSVPQISRGLQEETNEIMNQRLDNIKLVLNKRWLVKRGKNVDMPSLVRNVPGGITMADDIENDVKPLEWQDVTQSSYMEQDRINTDMDELLGNFSPASVQQTRAPRTTDRSLTLLQGPANLLTEYLLETYVETFIDPVIRQVVLLEQHYETDATVLALVGEKAQLRQKYGKDEITDEMLNRELNIKVNVGMGATDPMTKLARFLQGVLSFAQISKLMPPGINLQEVAREIFGLTGYQDGDRFFTGQDPDKAKMQQMLTQLAQTLQQKVKDKEGDRVVKLQTAREKNQTQAQIAQQKNFTDIIRTIIAEDSDKRQILTKLLADLNKPVAAPKAGASA
jgi:hypothetical protein